MGGASVRLLLRSSIAIPFKTHPGRVRTEPGSQTNARPIIDQYKGNVWAGNARFAKLSLGRSGNAPNIRTESGGTDSDKEIHKVYSTDLSYVRIFPVLSESLYEAKNNCYCQANVMPDVKFHH